MTAPDGNIPGGSVNYGSLAAFAAKTEQDWMDELRGNTSQPWEGVLDGLFFGLNSDQPFVLAIFEALARALGLGGVWDTIDGVLGDIADAIGSLAGGAVDVAAQIAAAILDAFQKLATALGLSGAWTTITDAVNAIGGWISGQLAAVPQMILDAFKQLANALGLSGAWTTIAAVVAAIGGFINSTFTSLGDRITAVVGNLQALLDGIAGAAGATVAAALAALNAVKTNLQALIDGIWKAFTGGSSVGHSVTEAVTAVTNWLLNSFQSLVDGIANLFFAGTGRPVADAIAAIGNIFTTANNADSAAAQANASIDAIKAQQAGGFADEFEKPAYGNLDANWQQKNLSISDAYGYNGLGSAVGVMNGTFMGPVQYVQITKPLTTPNMRVSAVLSRAPWWDLLVKSSWYLLIQANANDRACYGVEIMNTTCQFFSMDAAGTQTSVGAVKTIPANQVGVPYMLEIKDRVLTLKINNVVAATQAVTADLPGRCIGFGGKKVAYTSLNDNPLAQFAGISWQPA